MSGGSMDYLYSKIEFGATFSEDSPERKAFRKHLELVIKALHDIEWVDSGDYGYGRENEAILKCINKTDILEAAKERLDESIKEAKETLKQYG